jgi:hypothetical protein
MDVRQICFCILRNVRSSATVSVKEHVERYVVPYMVKYGLNKDEILLAFIKVSVSSRRY